MAVTEACAKHFVQPATVMVTASGSAGAGIVGPSSPIVGPVDLDMANFMDNQMKAIALAGTKNLLVCRALAAGVIAGLPTLVLIGVSVGVGVGAGTGKVTGFNPAVFKGFLTQSMAQKKLIGSRSPDLVTAISNGICLYLNSVSSVPAVSIVGSPSPSGGLAFFPAQFS